MSLHFTKKKIISVNYRLLKFISMNEYIDKTVHFETRPFLKFILLFINCMISNILKISNILIPFCLNSNYNSSFKGLLWWLKEFICITVCGFYIVCIKVMAVFLVRTLLNGIMASVKNMYSWAYISWWINLWKGNM